MKFSIFGVDSFRFFSEIFSESVHTVTWHTNLEQYKNEHADVKIFLIEFEKEMLVHEHKLRAQSELLHQASACSDFVFVDSFEWHAHSCHLFRKDFNPVKNNIYWIIQGTAQGHESNIIEWQRGLALLQHIYEPLYPVLDAIDTTSIKPYWFDALLGRRTPPREFIIYQIEKNKLESNVIKSIYGLVHPTMPLDKNPDFVWEPKCKMLENSNNTWIYNTVEFYGQQMLFPFTLPLTTYEKTAYSIISETEFENSLIYITEKTAKVMLSKRIFIAFGNQGYIKYLRSLGFKTFDSFMDESYDDIEDNYERWQAAWKQLMWLCNQNQSSIIELAQPIINHNYQHMKTTDWRQPVVDKLRKLLQL